MRKRSKTTENIPPDPRKVLLELATAYVNFNHMSLADALLTIRNTADHMMRQATTAQAYITAASLVHPTSYAYDNKGEEKRGKELFLMLTDMGKRESP